MKPSFLTEFNQMKSILCMCPECNHISRLSDLHLSSRQKAPLTWLDTYEKKLQHVEDKEAKFDEEKQQMRDEAIKRGRAQIPRLIRKAMDPKISGLKYDPYDIKALLHPIDYVVFDGMNKSSMKNVVLLSESTKNTRLNSLHNGIAKAVEKKAYDWKVVRVTNNGEVNYE